MLKLRGLRCIGHGNLHLWIGPQRLRRNQVQALSLLGFAVPHVNPQTTTLDPKDSAGCVAERQRLPMLCGEGIRLRSPHCQDRKTVKLSSKVMGWPSQAEPLRSSGEARPTPSHFRFWITDSTPSQEFCNRGSDGCVLCYRSENTPVSRNKPPEGFGIP